MVFNKKAYNKKFLQKYFEDPINNKKRYEVYLEWKSNNPKRRRYIALKDWYRARGQLEIFYKRHGRLEPTPLQAYKNHLREEHYKIQRKILPKRIPKVRDPELKKSIVRFRSRLANTLR